MSTDAISPARRIELASLVERIRQIGAEQACIDFDQAFALAFPSAHLKMELEVDFRHRTATKDVRS